MTSQKCVLCFVLTLCLICASLSLGGIDAFLDLEGESQGPIQGESTEPGHENWIEIIGFEHSISVPRDPNGKPKTGKSAHQPVKITKPIDCASPKLLKAMDDTEIFSDFRLEFMRIEGGPLVNYYTIELTGAQITGIRKVKLNADNPDNDWSRDMESVYFTYDTITETFEPDIEQSADWDFEQAQILRVSDLNFDGSVDLLDIAILASEWLEE